MNSKQKNKLILASGSPRRKEMLTASGLEFLVIPANIDEIPKTNESGKDYVKRNAFEKALAVTKQVSPNDIILSADTIVVTKNDVILEKPLSEEHAENMLKMLSNESHLVYTGYTLMQNGTELISRVIETIVTFRKISADEIQAYIASKEPFDKAGGYGIQGKAMGFVTNVNGSYTNVIGLPLAEVLVDLTNFAGIKPFAIK
ncbi:Maf family protein [Pigmentibacter sp. JX0631]|uniref:Maf family protein n=1 Tax=Pigmentibacter sp. JX0631 TaxID=2976982 RepID=UPI0024683351|nr:Maf family protein [Pigmentibacter sp. JX0631]WGL59996.1 Maf family protein [Pigmentibacter sp. JX0631]